MKPTPTDERRHLRQFIERWRTVGAELDERRLRELAALDEAAAREMTLDLFALWRPALVDEHGGSLVLHQQVFRRIRSRKSPGP